MAAKFPSRTALAHRSISAWICASSSEVGCCDLSPFIVDEPPFGPTDRDRLRFIDIVAQAGRIEQVAKPGVIAPAWHRSVYNHPRGRIVGWNPRFQDTAAG